MSGNDASGAHHRGERGSSTVTVVLVLPGLLVAMMGVVQFAFWYHAQHVALAAAQEGTRAARVADGSVEDGRSRALWMLDELGRRLVLSPAVAVERGPHRARVEVRGYAPQWVPGLRLPVRAVASGEVEVFRGDPP
jgi:hypothetical protein